MDDKELTFVSKIYTRGGTDKMQGLVYNKCDERENVLQKFI